MLTQEEIFAVLKQNVLAILPDLPPDAISMEESLKGMGANSIDRMEIVVNTMEAIGVRIPLTHFAQVPNIAGLVNLYYEAALSVR